MTSSDLAVMNAPGHRPDNDVSPQEYLITQANHLPIITAFCQRIGLVEVVNRVVPTKMTLDVGTIVQAMVLDILSGRSPLYRLGDAFKQQDTELLLGKSCSATALNDTTVGRAMDAIFAVGAEKVFNGVAFAACRRFDLDTSTVHFDTTSVSVWGDYDVCKIKKAGGLIITLGHSKDHRPDLKQFLIKVLCVEKNIPIMGGCVHGNTSDKTVNNHVLTRIARHMAKHGLAAGDFIYVADAAMVTKDNLEIMGANLFISRLPFTYNETDRVIAETIADGSLVEIGTLNETPSKASCPAATYHIAEKEVVLYGQSYRAVVVHSSAHDRRRLKRLAKEIVTSRATIEKLIAAETKLTYFCRADAEAAAVRLGHQATSLHGITTEVIDKVRYVRGRPCKDGTRKVSAIRYQVTATVFEKAEQLELRRREAGCFVLLCNVPREGPKARTSIELLRAYKEQYGIEKNYSFLKDPLIVNDIFLKKPDRIEVLGAILLISLLVWNLIEYVLRGHVVNNNVDLPGWDKKKTRRPTAYMMSTKFEGLQITNGDNGRRLGKPLTEPQKCYLNALGLTEKCLLRPFHNFWP